VFNRRRRRCPVQPFGDVITGENIGFQRVSQRPNKENVIVGKLMVRINGQWFETASPLSVVKVSK
jgi:hypothetical protein